MKLRRKTMRQAKSWLNVSIVGLQFPVAIVIGYLWGKFLDNYLGTWPWLTLVFSLFGIAAGFINLFRITAQAARDEAREAAEDASRKAEDQGDTDGSDNGR